MAKISNVFSKERGKKSRYILKGLRNGFITQSLLEMINNIVMQKIKKRLRGWQILLKQTEWFCRIYW